MEPKQTLQLRIDYRIICGLLLLVIVGMLVSWRPWQAAPSPDRKISVTGQATLKAEPDQFQFSPLYERDTTAEITKLNDDIVKKLKELGVADNQIKNNASRYGSTEIYYFAPVDGKEKSTLNLTVTLTDKSLTQKVQDYLLTTNPKGSITPYPSFSTAKQKQLQDQARDQAIIDARRNAEKTADGLGARLGKVQEVSEGQGGGVYPLLMGDKAAVSTDSAGADDTSLSLQPGQDEFTYSVSVTFAIR